MSAASAAVAAADPRLTASPEATERLGEALSPQLATGDLLLLDGPLGAGKTRFVAGLARGLGARGRVRSPSFTLLHEYSGRVPLFHADLYRLETREVAGLGLEESLEQGALVVEWGERLPESDRRDALVIGFEIVSDRERRLVATGVGPRGRELLAFWRTLP